MNTRALVVGWSLGALLFASLPAFSAERPGPEPIPDVLYAFSGASEPTWVVASKVVDAAGRARADVLGRTALGIQEELDAPETGECLRFQEVFISHAMPPPRATLEDAVTHSNTQMLAEVTGKAYGFHGRSPGQLLQVVPVQTFGQPLPMRHYYFFLPVGEFLLGDRLICQEDAEYAPPPEVGTEVFLFISGQLWGPRNDLMLLYGPGDVVPVARDGSLLLPEHYVRAASEGGQGDLLQSKTELLEHIGSGSSGGSRR